MVRFSSRSRLSSTLHSPWLTSRRQWVFEQDRRASSILRRQHQFLTRIRCQATRKLTLRYRCRLRRHRCRLRRYQLVKWKGYDDPTGEPEDFLLNEAGVPIVPLQLFLRGEWCNSNFTYVTVNAPILFSQLHTRFSPGAHATYRCYPA